MLVAAPASAQAADAKHTPAAAASSGLIPVWAFVNGAAPVAHARVRITSSGKPVRQAGGRMWKRTNAQGVVVLRMRRVPRRFTVIVRGGRAAGMRVRGSQRRAVPAYRGTRVVEVNPLTTLVTRLRRRWPKLDNRRAVRAVKRYFHVPQWADLGQNLRDLGDRWFNARAYLREVRRAGSIDRLNRRLARRIASGSARRARRAPTALAAQATGWSSLPQAKFLVGGLKYLGANVAGTVTQGLIGAGLGALLNLAQSTGLITLPKSDMDEVRDQLDAIGAHLTRLEGKIENLSTAVARSHASQLLHLSDDVVGRIDEAQARLALLANLSPGDPTEKRFAQTIDAYIGGNLQDAGAILNRHLNPALAIGDNVIKAASRALATERFFDERDSTEVEDIYYYFGMYQLQLAVLLVNYWNAHPDAYSLDTRTALMARIEANVTTTQQRSLKPPVPSGMFFDTRTPRFMWGTRNETVDAYRVRSEELYKRADLVMGDFKNWQMPANGDYRNLLDGASGEPRKWLQDHVKVPLKHRRVWASDSLYFAESVTSTFIRVHIFDLDNGQPARHDFGNTPWEFDCRGSNAGPRKCYKDNLDAVRFLRSKTGGLMLLRYLAPDESYWW
jgi:hypothetical protein